MSLQMDRELFDLRYLLRAIVEAAALPEGFGEPWREVLAQLKDRQSFDLIVLRKGAI